MLIINIPKSFSKEIYYTLKVLLTNNLGIKFKVKENNINSDIIIKYKSKSIIIKNSFFSKFNETIGYLSIQNIPQSIQFLTNEEYGIKKLPILYGEAKIIKKPNSLILYSDIIASSFFMLSRWEEFVAKKRDGHKRFLAEYSLAYKFKFLNRPIVNEYTELLDILLHEINYNETRINREFKIIPTHDVDIPFFWNSCIHKLKSVLISLYHFKLKETLFKLKYIFKNKDPYDTFNFLMTLSEKNNLKSHFFFMSGGITIYDNKYRITDKRIKKLINNIKSRNHLIGFHPSYNSYNNFELLKKESEQIFKTHNIKISFGRQHYLRFEIPTTWQLWDQLQMNWDSTLSFADKMGFRCGICFTYPVFNIITRKELNLKESPLIIMDTTFEEYEKLSLNQSIERIKELKNIVKKFDGEFVFLWHNSSLNRGSWVSKEKILQELYNKY